MKSRRDIEALARQATIRTNEQANARVLRKMRAAYAEAGEPAGASRRLGYWDLVFENRFARLAAVAVILLALGAIVGQFGDILPGGGVAWADVTRRFQSVPFFSATIYIKEGATAEPTQMELWMSRDGRTRLRRGSQVIFARDGAVTKAFDIKSRGVVEPDEWAVLFLERIGRADTFSLETVIRVMFGGEMQDVTPLVNPDAVISQDVVVFDVELPGTPEWVRIWALRESRLPVRIRVWDPRSGDATDAVFEYSREQADAFFDPNAFETLLRSRRTSSRVNTAYAFLKDPGGRDITPEDMFAGSGYHVPEIEQVGITPDGAVWVIAARGRNRMPDGRNFYGFTRIQDDLGREYEGVYKSHRTATDQSMEVFVPGDYPFDRRVPGRITLLCEADDRQPTTNDELIGAVELTTWKQGRMWPEGTITDDEWSFRTRMAWKHCDSNRHEQAERILRTIAGDPEQEAGALERERIRLRMLVQRGKFDEAARLGQRLMPALERDYRSLKGFGPNPSVFCDYLVALGHTGRLDEAGQTWLRIESILAHLPSEVPISVRRRMEEEIRRSLDGFLRVMVRRLVREAHLTAEQIEEILGDDVDHGGEYARLIEQARRDAAWADAREAAERHLSELAGHYESHPLPEKAEFIERPDGRTIHLAGSGNALPGHAGYKVLPLNYSVGAIVSNLRAIGADKSDASNVHPYMAAIRFADGTEDRELRADLVYRDGIELAECFHLVLAACGLELTTETLPVQSVLVARYDGRTLRSHTEVYGPWHVNDGNSGIRTWRIADLLECLSQQIAAGSYVVDETGVEVPLCLGDGAPQWQGAEGVEQARRWLQEQFGVMVAEEDRAITIYRIQRRAQ